MTRDERIYHHLYVDTKSPLDNAERISDLEILIIDMADRLRTADSLTSMGFFDARLEQRMADLRIEV